MTTQGEPIDPDPELIIEIVATTKPKDPWHGAAVAAHLVLIPAFNDRGLDGLARVIAASARSPHIATALVEFAGLSHISPLRIFTFSELVEAAAASVMNSSFEHEWAWHAVWFGDFDDEEHWNIVMALIDRVPDDDDALWLVGDGPLSELEMRPGMVERLHELATSHPKLARIRHLVERP
jgi:hypothetical protein